MSKQEDNSVLTDRHIDRPFNPAAKEMFWTMLRSEILNRRFNRLPLWRVKARNRVLKKWLGSCEDCYSVFSPFYCSYGKNVHVGKNFFLNVNCVFMDYDEIIIGDNVWIGPNVSILTVNHPMWAEERNVFYMKDSFEPQGRGNKEYISSVVIGDNVWIATGVTICAGVKIGSNTVIGAGSVVTKDIPSNVFACGVPCEVKKEIIEYV